MNNLKIIKVHFKGLRVPLMFKHKIQTEFVQFFSIKSYNIFSYLIGRIQINV